MRAAALAERCAAALVVTRWPDPATDRVAGVEASAAFLERDADALVALPRETVRGVFTVVAAAAPSARAGGAGRRLPDPEDDRAADDFPAEAGAAFLSSLDDASSMDLSRSSNRLSAPSNSSAFSRLRMLLAADAAGAPRPPFTADPRERFVERFCLVNLSSHLSRNSRALRIAVRSIFSVARSTVEPKLDSKNVRSVVVRSDRTDSGMPAENREGDGFPESVERVGMERADDGPVDFAMIVLLATAQSGRPLGMFLTRLRVPPHDSRLWTNILPLVGDDVPGAKHP